MNTRTLNTSYEWPTNLNGSKAAVHVEAWTTPAPLKNAAAISSRLLLAAIPALSILVASAWAIDTFASSVVLQAAIWATGFIFLALAVDTTRPNLAGLLLTGLSLPVLAMLSSRVAVEFAIIAAALVAGWVAAAIIKR